jgi:hypothetical protein
VSVCVWARAGCVRSCVIVSLSLSLAVCVDVCVYIECVSSEFWATGCLCRSNWIWLPLFIESTKVSDRII